MERKVFKGSKDLMVSLEHPVLMEIKDSRDGKVMDSKELKV
jgi:hypothetical protein